jgi:hypothetical protein
VNEECLRSALNVPVPPSELGDGYQATVVNDNFIADAVLTNGEALEAMGA